MSEFYFICEWCGKDCGYTCEQGMVHLGELQEREDVNNRIEECYTLFNKIEKLLDELHVDASYELECIYGLMPAPEDTDDS